MRLLPSIALLCLTTSAFAASTLSGVVTNKTTNKPSPGDEVTLIRLQQGMQEAAHTKTDAKGQFKLDVADDGVHLVRVTHDKANYFRPVQPGADSVEVEVYNAAAKVEGVTGEADVLRIQSDPGGSGLRIVENFFVKNDSTPPRTQFSDRPFEFYLPAGAVVQGSAALGPGGMPVQAAPVPLGDTPNHYAFVFPVRPGETRFQITYSLPYSGSFQFSPRPTLPTDTVAIMMPKSMSFKGGTPNPYTAVTEETEAQTYVARNVQPSQPLEFTISGTGQLPRDTAAATPGANGGAAEPGSAAANAAQSGNTTATDTRPGGGLGVPVDPEGTNDPWAKYKWWILGGLALLLAGGAGVMLKGSSNTPAAPTTPQQPAYVPPAAAPTTGGSLLAALKEELFALETDHVQGRLTDTQYGEQKAALEVVLKRALTRTEAA
ncbi:carboxypeptidase regulatory-like domain-containing protein [Granulicella sibirica]|uniref:Carboxypeptidase regulatory-like domain-containing protein n=1 Tax=Granulicella sibirica TaxID=2479048 RepID=A0A4Q0T1H7_9BACT|nr:carboxypeptidase regulatory-like domain-containing protein [Granulicella sibirica]RXH56642.1 hypothetical protein GRAN_3499 [Granulicella sibirica]